MIQRITIQDIDKPKENKLKEEVKWICHSLGLMKGRDIEDMSFRIFYEFIKELENEQDSTLIASQDIANKLGIETSTVNHHIRSMMNSGIILREKRKIKLRGRSLTSAVEEIKKDTERIFNDILEVSKKIDKSLRFS